MSGITTASTPSHFLHPKPKYRYNKNKLIGRWRLFWGLCPACNSDAPKLYDCKVCEHYRTSVDGMPTINTKRRWWNKFIQSLNKK